ncbi:unnamed protein product [Timema podura]|uniref:Uncharacterized protein n=1 Tax=Timema podura TaxID=61482 RepID=A0ABN7P4X9_TIMPD|nr:unnamed protein product [Timema podura]
MGYVRIFPTLAMDPVTVWIQFHFLPFVLRMGAIPTFLHAMLVADLSDKSMIFR